jgi:hypothetical protein
MVQRGPCAFLWAIPSLLAVSQRHPIVIREPIERAASWELRDELMPSCLACTSFIWTDIREKKLRLRICKWVHHSTGPPTIRDSSDHATSRGTALSYLDLHGNTRTIWEQPGNSEIGGISAVWAVPSRDGRHVAINSFRQNNNVWMLENF